MRGKTKEPSGIRSYAPVVVHVRSSYQNDENEILSLYHDAVIINFTPEVHFDHMLCIAHLHLLYMIQLNRVAVCSFKDSSLSILL